MMTKFIKFRFATIAIVLLAVFVSCSVFMDNSMPESGFHNPDYYEDVLVQSSSLPLYSNLVLTSTKSSHEESDYVSLESLLDRTKSKSKTFKQYNLTEIPFKSNTSPCLAILSDNSVISDGSYSEITLFLIETIDTQLNTIDRKVVTMIPDENYKIRRNAGEAYSYINKGVFSGIILYSNLDGSFRDVYVFGGDFSPIKDAQVIDHSDVTSYSEAYYLFLVNNMVTKCDENGVCLEPSICIAYREDSSQEDENTPPPPSGEGDGPISPGTGGGGGSTNPPAGGSSSDGESEQEPIINNPDESTEQVPEEKQKYVVSLYSAEGGSTKGSGVYQEGSFATLIAIPESSYILDRWVGDLAGREESVTRIIMSDISSTAYFRKLLEIGPTRPCLDTLTGIMNPLMEMELAPSNTWSSNYKGATFGKTRVGSKFHSGLDLYAEPGAPIYSMFNGVVSDNNYITEQPMRSEEYNTDKKYPPGYIGDTDGAGNRVYIDSNVNGENISIGYWHLLVNTPIAINPRTGEPFKPGDIIYQGEIIAYTGRTGNAYKVPYAHLHLVIKKNNKYVNPEPYINGKLNTTGQDENKVVSSTEVNNIKCH